MARKPLKPCAHPGCGALTRTVYCDAHRPRDQDRRGAAAAKWRRLYDLDVWKHHLRPNQLLREPYCRACTAKGIREHRPELLRVPATDVDHITPHRGNMRLFLDPSNLQSLCHSCHSRKTMQEMAEKRGNL